MGWVVGSELILLLQILQGLPGISDAGDSLPVALVIVSEKTPF